MTRIKYVAMLALAIGLVGCGDDDGTDPGTDSGTPGEDGGTMMMDDAGETGGDTIVDVAVANGSFTTLVGALESTGLDEALAGDGPFTVFAPTDAAFAALPLTTLAPESTTPPPTARAPLRCAGARWSSRRSRSMNSRSTTAM